MVLLLMWWELVEKLYSPSPVSMSGVASMVIDQSGTFTDSSWGVKYIISRQNLDVLSNIKAVHSWPHQCEMASSVGETGKSTETLGCCQGSL